MLQGLEKGNMLCYYLNNIMRGVIPGKVDFMSKFEEIIATESDKFDEFRDASAAKLKALFNRKAVEEIIEEKNEERKVKVWLVILAIIGVVAIGCTIGILIYRKNKPDYLDDFEDDFDDDDDDDLFEEE